MIATPPHVSLKDLAELASKLDRTSQVRLGRAVRTWTAVKEQGGKVVVATGSGPNLHEGVTAQVAELVRLGLVDGVLTSSAVAGHEMAGSLEMVRRIAGERLGMDQANLPADGRTEVSLLPPGRLEILEKDIELDRGRLRDMLAAPGPNIIKVAGNLAYPTGLWVERMAQKLTPLCQKKNRPLEWAAGMGAHELTMLGACARKGVPCLVTVPQLVGGGRVGMALGDSISVSERSRRVADLLGSADLIIESGVALTQEIHDGPLELHTGHGMWSLHDGKKCFSLADKAIVRIDLDPQLERVWAMQRRKNAVGKAIDQGLPKAVSMAAPFRMEMSGFARVAGSLPITADLGAVWPLLAARTAKSLGVNLGFLCYKQGTPRGEELRRFLVEEITPFDPGRAVEALEGI